MEIIVNICSYDTCGVFITSLSQSTTSLCFLIIVFYPDKLFLIKIFRLNAVDINRSEGNSYCVLLLIYTEYGRQYNSIFIAMRNALVFLVYHCVITEINWSFKLISMIRDGFFIKMKTLKCIMFS